jgi:hypothetical protein
MRDDDRPALPDRLSCQMVRMSAIIETARSIVNGCSDFTVTQATYVQTAAVTDDLVLPRDRNCLFARCWFLS